MMTSSSPWLIRQARPDDVPAMAALVEEFAEYMRALGDTTAPGLDAETLRRDGFGPAPAFQGVVAERRGVVAGFLLHHAGYDTDAAVRLLFVIDLYVTASVRGQGIGAALLGAARDIAVRDGAAQLVWTVDRRNALARRFYERMGADYVQGLELMCLDV